MPYNQAQLQGAQDGTCPGLGCGGVHVPQDALHALSQRPCAIWEACGGSRGCLGTSLRRLAQDVILSGHHGGQWRAGLEPGFRRGTWMVDAAQANQARGAMVRPFVPDKAGGKHRGDTGRRDTCTLRCCREIYPGKGIPAESVRGDSGARRHGLRWPAACQGPSGRLPGRRVSRALDMDGQELPGPVPQCDTPNRDLTNRTRIIFNEFATFWRGGK